MRYISLLEVLELHISIIMTTGGSQGIRDIHALESAINQPRITFDKNDLYPNLISKAAALCYFLVMNHPFIDGNKRVGHAAMETLLVLNGYEIKAELDEQEKIIIDLARGEITLELLTKWLKNNVVLLTKE